MNQKVILKNYLPNFVDFTISSINLFAGEMLKFYISHYNAAELCKANILFEIITTHKSNSSNNSKSNSSNNNSTQTSISSIFYNISHLIEQKLASLVETEDMLEITFYDIMTKK